MNRNKKLASGILSGILAASMVSPVFAATNTESIIDQNRKGTLNIHKIVENDGRLEDADGLGIRDSRVAVDNIGFDYVKIADIANVTGIIVSEDGKIALGTDGSGLTNEVQVGTYFVGNDKLDELMAAAGAFPKATYILQEAANSPANTLQYEFNDDVQNKLLKTEQDAVNAAKNDLMTKKAAKIAADNNYSAAVAARVTAETERDAIQVAKTAADIAKAEADQALTDAVAAANAASTAATNAANSLSTAQTQLNNAQAAFDSALAAYQTNDNSTLNNLANAQAALTSAQNDLQAAQNSVDEATAKKAETEANLAAAQAALDAAQEISDAAVAAHDAAANGTADSVTGTQNAVDWAAEQLANAQAYLAACEAADDAAADALSDANDDLAAAQTALNTAQTALASAISANDTAAAAFQTAYDALVAAQAAFDAAQEASADAVSASADAAAARDAAQIAADNAAAKQTELLNALNSANSDLSAASAAESTANSAKTAADSAYATSLAAYNTAVNNLDDAAEDNGIVKVYTTEELEAAWAKVLATLSEEDIAKWVAENAPTSVANTKSTYGDQAEGYTDDNGTVTFSGMDLGLYVVAETDISYHDGIAGAWNDNAGGGFINGDQMNTYDGAGNYTITPIDGFGQTVAHTYAEGDVYNESHNPEAPVVETTCAPFMVSLPTTNTTDSTGRVAAGDNDGTEATVWQYTVDVYPKNQTTAIYKRIVDPDEAAGAETLRTSEDFQLGDIIESVIWADAPTLQANFLEEKLEAGDTNSVNKHLGYVISDTMSDGLTFDGIERVMIIPKAQLMDDGTNVEETMYFNAAGALVDRADAVVDASAAPADEVLKTEIRYYDAVTGNELTQAQFLERTGLAANAALNFYSDIDNDGVEQGDTANVYPAKSGYTGSYYATRVSYKKLVVATGSATMPSKNGAFELSNTVDPATAGIELTSADYALINTDAGSVTLVDGAGNTKTVIEEGTHGWAIQLTESGLAKLNARTVDSVVVVYFTSILNKDAKIGEVEMNMNYPTLNYVNSNTSFKSVGGNEVYAYSYELQIKKEGVEDGRNVKFIISRDDKGDIAQADEKDLTDTVSQVRSYNQGDSIRFVKEKDGVYHVWGYVASDAGAEGDSFAAAETSEVNGVTYYTVTPAEDGKLIIKGLDSNDYIFQEIQTEDEKNLLTDTFKVCIRANDDADASMRDGRIAKATVESAGSEAIDITIGVAGEGESDSMTSGVNRGIASMVVNNYDAIDLKTGGRGRTLIYICGVAMVAGLSVGYLVSKKKRSAEEK